MNFFPLRTRILLFNKDSHLFRLYSSVIIKEEEGVEKREVMISNAKMSKSQYIDIYIYILATIRAEPIAARENQLRQEAKPMVARPNPSRPSPLFVEPIEAKPVAAESITA